MKSTKRSKEELATSLKEKAIELSLLKEKIDLPSKTPLREKLDAHSPRWNSLYREIVAEAFYYAKKLKYDRVVYEHIKASGCGDENENERIVSYCSETLMKVVYRRFANIEDNNIDDSFILYFETDLQMEFKRFVLREKQDNQRQGTKFSDKSRRIVSHYFRFKEDLKNVAKNRKDLTEEKIQGLYLSTHNHYNLTSTELKELLASSFQTYVLGDTKKNDEKESSILDCVIDKSFIPECFIAADENRADFNLLLDCMDELYNKKQKRAQSYYSVLMTQWILEKIKKDSRIDVSILSNYSFVDKNLFCNFLEKGTVPDRNEILLLFPVIKDGKIVLDKNGNQKYKDKGRASNDMKMIERELKIMLNALKN